MITKQIIPSNKTLPYSFCPSGEKWQSTENQNLSIWESGSNKVLIQNTIKLIEAAKELICLQSFLIQNNPIIEAVLQAQERGVKVYILTSNAHLANKPFEEDESFAKESYIKLLNEKFKNRVLLRGEESFHAKYILIDPKSQPKGVLFTCNLTEKPLTENPELAVSLSKKQVEELFQTFVFHFWEMAKYEQCERDTLQNVSPIQQFAQAETQEILLTCKDSNYCNLKESLKKAVLSAKKEISFATFGFDIQNELCQLLLKKCQEGVKVTVFVRTRQKAIEGHLSQLVKAGATIFTQEKLHAKMLVVDNSKGFIFTANFEKHGLDEGMEVGIALSDSQTQDLLKIVESWKASFPFKIKPNISLKDLNGRTYGRFLNERFEEVEVKQKIEKVMIPTNTTLAQLQKLIEDKSRQNANLADNFAELVLEYEWKLGKMEKPSRLVEKLADGIVVKEYSEKRMLKGKKGEPDKEETFFTKWIQIDANISMEKIANLQKEDYKSLNLYF